MQVAAILNMPQILLSKIQSCCYGKAHCQLALRPVSVYSRLKQPKDPKYEASLFIQTINYSGTQ
jgi:hypothetical protein